MKLTADFNKTIGKKSSPCTACFLTANGEDQKAVELPSVLPGESILVIRTELLG